ncbi:hypothetical protein DUG83_19445 [Vibrio parahaemolyticus]|uniref:hypothetical protein n=1 Tax=Vibrio parahaemolyticus TaxID=670 RepID=UPI00111F2C4F|nr:hypothetical protein [Vibrio parahaemolyticus]EGR2723641.1 hypothetical protein [Vibrio parahaemolyticus]EJB1759229.1 hypothetical protein [Vibrio parahaemolyticus]MCR9851134.1 hypothetical protein [Vibrio parahaemolyticus]TOB93073.1 hypothetical protein CGJ96_20725 [Vibrio parahaemolyticus]HCG5469950.1 hypothetical protein [Vibrio parahaemolyticus]
MVSCEESLAQWQRSHPCVVCVSLQEYQEQWSIEVIGLPDAETHNTVNQDQPIEQCLYQLLAYERLVVADKQHFFAEMEKRLTSPSLFTDHVIKQLKQRTTAIGFDKRYRTAQQLRTDYINAQVARLKSHRH